MTIEILRVAVRIDGAFVPRWVARLLDRIDSCSFVELVGFVRNAESPPRESGHSRLLYRLYSRLDARYFGAALDPFDEIGLSERLDRLPELDVGKLEQEGLDVLLNLGSGGVGDELLDCSRYGVWSFRHHEGARVTETVLLRLAGQGDAGDVIYRSFSATDPFSRHRSRTRVYAKSAEFVMRKLRDVHRDGELPQGDRAAAEAPIDQVPTNRQMLRFGAKLAARLARHKTRRALAREQWFLAYRRSEAGLPVTKTFRAASVIVPPSDRFYADPCLVDWQGSSFLFFEDFPYADAKGVISCCKLTPDGHQTQPELVLERPYHLSYPFVFFAGEDAFMLPETAANGAIELYRARSFPSDWVLEAVLVSDVRAVDPTLIEHHGRYWLFSNVAVEGASTNDELCVFSAQSLRGPWAPHPRNPVISDVRRARPAGRPFIDESGSLIRPSQDCSGLYGWGVVFNRIEELSETAYRETTIGRLDPGWQRHNRGTHTYTRSEKWEAVDGRSWVRRESRLRRSFRA